MLFSAWIVKGSCICLQRKSAKKKKKLSYKAINKKKTKKYIWVGPVTRKAQQECAVSLPNSCGD